MDKTEKILKAIKSQVQFQAPIATEMFVPNYSGIKDEVRKTTAGAIVLNPHIGTFAIKSPDSSTTLSINVENSGPAYIIHDLGVGDISFGSATLTTTGNLNDGVNQLTIANAKTAYTHSQVAGGDSVHVSTAENTSWDTAATHAAGTGSPHTAAGVGAEAANANIQAHIADNTQAHSDYMLNTGDTATGTYTFNDLTVSGMLNYWALNETSGSTASDQVSGNTGTATGTTIVDGKLSKCRSWAETTDEILLASGLNRICSALPFTLLCWIKTSSNGTTAAPYINTDILSRGDFMSRNNELGQNSGKTAVQSAGGHWTGTITISDNVWHHVAFVGDGAGNIKSYVDGVLDINAAYSYPDAADQTKIGHEYPGDDNNHTWAGLIDELAVFNYAMTITEVQTSYNSGSGTAYAPSKTKLIKALNTPSASASAGTVGEICWDAGYIYICTATNVWERVAIAAW